MKKILAFILTLCLLATAMVSGAVASDDSDVALPSASGEFLIGFSRRDITPLNSVPLGGYANPQDRLSMSVRDKIYANSTAIQDAEGNTALIITLDLHGMEPLGDYLRYRIEDATGVPAENILLNASHTHASYEISCLSGGGGKYEEDRVRLIDNIVSAAAMSLRDLGPCEKVLAGTIETENLNFIRRYIYDEEGNAIAHESEADGNMPVVRFVREDKKDIIIANWAAHCDTVYAGNQTAVSADYIGAFRDMVEEKDGDAYLSVLMGAAGDVNPRSSLDDNTFWGTTQYGRSLARALLGGLDELEEIDLECTITSETAIYRAEYDHSRDDESAAAKEVLQIYQNTGGDTPEYYAALEKYGFSSYYEVQAVAGSINRGILRSMNLTAISIGNIVFVAAPYEMFAETGRNIKEASEFDLTFISAFTNGQIGYIPTEDVFENGGYEVYSCAFVPGTAEDIEAVCIALTKKLHN